MDRTKRTAFLKITCPRCSFSTIVYGKCSTNKKCSKCNYLLTKTSGGKAKIRAPIKEVLLCN
ncbi:MAG: 30S ribosomal protein S27e [Nanoarchaeota archaeon]|nr:30S ribosomal protein S27e [Nanoarchaeota archaeon]